MGNRFLIAASGPPFYTGRIQCEVLTTLPFCFSWIKKFLGQQSKSEMTARWRNYSSNLWKIFNIVGPNNFSTELSSQIFDCCPRNFLIQEERIGNVVSTSHWIRHVFCASLGIMWYNGLYGTQNFASFLGQSDARKFTMPWLISCHYAYRQYNFCNLFMKPHYIGRNIPFLCIFLTTEFSRSLIRFWSFVFQGQEMLSILFSQSAHLNDIPALHMCKSKQNISLIPENAS